jgi:hypothetical protein
MYSMTKSVPVYAVDDDERHGPSCGLRKKLISAA